MKRLFAVLFFSWLAALLVLTYYPNFPTLKVRIRHEWFRLDYIGHLGFYAVLTALFLLWRSGWRKKIQRKLLLLTLIVGFLLGSFTEISQVFIPGRTVNPYDLMYNCIGIFVGVAGICLLAWGHGSKEAGKTT